MTNISPNQIKAIKIKNISKPFVSCFERLNILKNNPVKLHIFDILFYLYSQCFISTTDTINATINLDYFDLKHH